MVNILQHFAAGMHSVFPDSETEKPKESANHSLL
jgi:hypothetical protein